MLERTHARTHTGKKRQYDPSQTFHVFSYPFNQKLCLAQLCRSKFARVYDISIKRSVSFTMSGNGITTWRNYTNLSCSVYSSGSLRVEYGDVNRRPFWKDLFNEAAGTKKRTIFEIKYCALARTEPLFITARTGSHCVVHRSLPFPLQLTIFIIIIFFFFFSLLHHKAEMCAHLTPSFSLTFPPQVSKTPTPPAKGV